MAGLQNRNGSFRLIFRFQRKQHTFTIGHVTPKEAEAKASQINYLLMRLDQKLISLPDNCDIVHFLQHDGNPPKVVTTTKQTQRKIVTLGILRDQYIQTHSNGTLEANTIVTCRMHFKHLTRILGEGMILSELTRPMLQNYITSRTSHVTATTVRKELATFRAAWNWGEVDGLTQGRFPNKGLRYPKIAEKPPFMTIAEAQRMIAQGAKARSVWDCVYLTSPEVTELLNFVKGNATQPWVYPMFCFAAHTGARRSEIMRATKADIDFEGNVITIHEKKRKQGVATSQRIPMSSMLNSVLKEWFEQHPSGAYLFCHGSDVFRSKKRSKTTGHANEQHRPTSNKDREARVRNRERQPITQLTRNELHYYFKNTLKGSPWAQLRGLHSLRHGFVSACASKGIDQRLVESWAGHMSADMSRRYRHMWPSKQQEAIDSVFG